MDQQLKTLGISPKAALAFLFPFLAALGASVASWIITGDFNEAEIRTALSGLIASGVASLGAYVGKPGVVVNDGPADLPVVPPGLQE